MFNLVIVVLVTYLCSEYLLVALSLVDLTLMV